MFKDGETAILLRNEDDEMRIRDLLDYNESDEGAKKAADRSFLLQEVLPIFADIFAVFVIVWSAVLFLAAGVHWTFAAAYALVASFFAIRWVNAFLVRCSGKVVTVEDELVRLYNQKDALMMPADPFVRSGLFKSDKDRIFRALDEDGEIVATQVAVQILGGNRDNADGAVDGVLE